MSRRALLFGIAGAALIGGAFFAFRDRGAGDARLEEPTPAEPSSRSAAPLSPPAPDAVAPARPPATPPPAPEWPAVTGRVFDALDGAAIAGARVLCVDSARREPDRLVATTDSNGEFSIASESIEPASYGFNAAGYFPVRGIGAAPGDRVEIALTRGTTVRARVVELRTREGVAAAEIAIEGRERLAADADGRFAFVAGPRTTRIEIEAPGHDRATYEEIVPPEDGGEIEFALAATEGVHFLVTDKSTGRPVDRVTIHGRETVPLGDGLVRAFSLPRIGDSAHADVAAPGYARRNVYLRVGARGTREDPFEVALEPAAAIVGRVVDEHGSPIAGARVWASGASLADESVLAPLETPNEFGTTDADGRFALEGLSSRAAYAVRVTHPGKKPALVESIVFAGPERRSVPDVVLASSESLSGTVRRRDDGSPVAGARIEVHSNRDEAHATTSSDGAFSLAMPEGANRLRVRARGLVPAHVTLGPANPGEIVEVALDPGLAIEGMILDAEGRPAAGACVRSFLSELPGDLRGQGLEYVYARDWPDVVADAEGRFRIEGLAPGSRFRIHPWLGSLGGVLVSPPIEGPIDAGTSGLVYRLGPAAERSGVRIRAVARDDGRPIAGVRASAAPADSAGATRYRMMPESGTGEIFVALEPERTASIVVHARGFRPAALEPLSVAKGEVRDVRVDLARAGSISGTLRHPDGRAAAGFEIGLVPLPRDGIEDKNSPWTTTKTDGRFAFAGLWDGEHRVIVYSPTSGPDGEAGLAPALVRPAVIAVADGEDAVVDVTIEEEPGAVVEGSVELPPGDGTISKIVVRLFRSTDDGRHLAYSARLAPGSDRFRFESVSAGTYRVDVERHGVQPGRHSTTWNYRPVPDSVTVPIEGVASLDIRPRTD